MAQVYIACQSPDAPRHPALCAFARVSLAPGESRRVVLPLRPDARTVVNARGERVPCEKATLYVGGGQPDARTRELTGRECLKIEITG